MPVLRAILVRWLSTGTSLFWGSWNLITPLLSMNLARRKAFFSTGSW